MGAARGRAGIQQGGLGSLDVSTTAESDPVIVRLMAADEANAVADLLVSAYTGDFSLTPDYVADIAAVAERAAEHEVWVAVDDAGVLLGALSTPRAGRAISPLARAGELDFRFLGVAQAARGRGVGEQLVRHVLALAAERGLHRVVLNTGPDMVAAQRLYDRMGFERLHEREFLVERTDGTTFLMMAYGRDVGADANVQGRRGSAA